ncbi:MAG: N-acetyltransferase, partial [Bacteroidota bacterium]
YRKRGVFRGLYEYMKTTHKDTFNAVITEVAIQNTRSSDAYKAIGFEVLKNYIANTQEWELMIWKWY